MPLHEELAGLTLEELIEDYGAEFTTQEHWYGVSWHLKIGGTELYEHPIPHLDLEEFYTDTLGH